MKLLTNGAVMVMIVGDRPYTEPVPYRIQRMGLIPKLRKPLPTFVLKYQIPQTV